MTTPGKLLDSEDLVSVTGYQRRAEQINALRAMRIPFYLNPRGEIVCTWAHVEGSRTKARDRESAINWDAVT